MWRDHAYNPSFLAENIPWAGKKMGQNFLAIFINCRKNLWANYSKPKNLISIISFRCFQSLTDRIEVQPNLLTVILIL